MRKPVQGKTESPDVLLADLLAKGMEWTYQIQAARHKRRSNATRRVAHGLPPQSKTDLVVLDTGRAC